MRTIRLKPHSPTLFVDTDSASIELDRKRHYILKEIITMSRGIAKGRLVVGHRYVDVDLDHIATTDHSAN